MNILLVIIPICDEVHFFLLFFLPFSTLHAPRPLLPSFLFSLLFLFLLLSSFFPFPLITPSSTISCHRCHYLQRHLRQLGTTSPSIHFSSSLFLSFFSLILFHFFFSLSQLHYQSFSHFHYGLQKKWVSYLCFSLFVLFYFIYIYFCLLF